MIDDNRSLRWLILQLDVCLIKSFIRRFCSNPPEDSALRLLARYIYAAYLSGLETVIYSYVNFGKYGGTFLYKFSGREDRYTYILFASSSRNFILKSCITCWIINNPSTLASWNPFKITSYKQNYALYSISPLSFLWQIFDR